MTPSAQEPWLGIEPRHLATFAALVETGSFRGAAEELGYVQSAVSQQIAQLERAVGTLLIERSRGNREPRLTAAGHALLAHARRVVIQLRAACADVAVLANDGPLRLAVEPAAAGLVPGIAQRLSALRPGAQLSVLELASSAQPDLVVSGQVDLAIGSFAELPTTVARRVLRRDAWVLLAPEGSPLAALGRVDSIADLRRVDLIEDCSHPLPRGARPPGVGQMILCDRLSVALDLVRARSGCAIVPASALDGIGAGVVPVGLGELLPERVVSIAWLKSRRLPGVLAALELHPPDEPADGKLLAVA
jgi:DNA-binding transcriptional LysR family regulator